MNTAGFQDETPPTEEERTITFEFTIAVKNDEAIIDQDFWIGAAMTLGDSQIWAGQLQITVANKTDRNLTIVSTMYTRKALFKLVNAMYVYCRVWALPYRNAAPLFMRYAN